MANINRVVISGNLTKDPELRQLPSGNSVCKLRMAVNTRIKDRDSGQWTDKPNYFDVTVWGGQGESVARYLQRGCGLLVDGRLEWREWDAQDGTKRQAVEIIAENTQFMGRATAAVAAAAAASARPATSRPPALRPCRRRRRSPTTTTSRSDEGLIDVARARPTSKTSTKRRGPGSAAGGGKRKICHFCKDKVEEVDYKNANALRRYISEKGKIRSRRITGACRRHQRQVAVAIKRAREMALLPYTGA